MAIQQITATGIESLDLATTLLQRSRLAHPHGGIWEAADAQWSWRRPRESDDSPRTFWIDEDGPVAGILLTSQSATDWQIDPVNVPGIVDMDIRTLWQKMMDYIAGNPEINFDVPINDADQVQIRLAREASLTPGDRDSTGWLQAPNGIETPGFPAGFRLVDRSRRAKEPHPMRDRNGEQVGQRLLQCSLYDPSLDLAVETDDGQVAGYSLYWYDPITSIGLVEPVRVHHNFQRKGLARVMLSHGINRLVARGAQKIKVSWETEAAGALYLGSGFQKASTTTWYTSRGL